MEICKKRIDEIDMAKGLAILFVFLIHLNEVTGLKWTGSALANILFTFPECIPILFFICSGYVYRAKGSVLYDSIKRIKQLLIPFVGYGLFVTAVYFIKYVVIDKETLINLIDNTIANFLGVCCFNIRTGTMMYNQMQYGFVAYWFIREMFVPYLFFIPIQKMIVKKSVFTKIFTIFILFLLAFFCNKFDVQDTLKDTFNSHVSYFIVLINIFGFTALLLLGNLLKEYNFFDIGSQNKKTRMILASVSLIIATIILATNNPANYAFQYGRWGQFKEWSIPISCLGGLSITYLIVFMFHYLKQWKGIADVFRFMGKHTLEILFLHYIIAEIILWINGTWWKIYYDHYPVEKFTWSNWLSVVIGDALILAAYIFIKDKIKKNKLVK